MTNCVHLLLVSTALLTFALDDLAFNSTPSSVEIRLRMHYILAIIHRIVNKLCPTLGAKAPRPAPQLQTTSDAPGAPGFPPAKSGPAPPQFDLFICRVLCYRPTVIMNLFGLNKCNGGIEFLGAEKTGETM